MKKIILAVCMLLSIMAIAVNPYAQAAIDHDGQEYTYIGGYTRVDVIDADEMAYTDKPINKLNRGLINGVTFWAEIPAQVAKVSRERDPLLGATIGTVQGTVASVVRAGSALFDTLTFFVPPYDAPIMKPEYALNRADDQIQEYLW